ncbi:gliding motility-associated C-terminal domain-containing protein [Fibrella sp. HMF5335]|uniref:Gliding motility-associated C-terminal domain-containing protein n=1 Tax=Fibrella rubiginis TaxID=2817060 RepID=A0A939K4K5_9BACT|nr:gliding motility-associated C-terminal domain-containing protein [Fibrella rubiginis]MBO0936281.1 gliding motility-associated C-terminal domain-containing protein [Fibrella rubiginis]
MRQNLGIDTWSRHSFWILCWLVLAVAGTATGQSLIPNGGFETYRNCPRQDNLLEEAVPWYNPNRATPDFYNGCFPTDQIELPPHSGAGLARLFLDKGWAEYLATPLTKPLEAGKCYYFEMYISTRTPNQYVPQTIGACFSSQPITSLAKDLLPVRPQLLDSQAKTITGPYKWDKISGTIKAVGGEQFVTIGSFNTLPVFLGFYYVFIDDVALLPVDLNLGNDTTLCGRKSTYLLKATTPGAIDYKWSDGSTSPTYLVKKPGKYWVTVTTPCNTLSDTITVDYALDFTLGADTTLCNGQSLVLMGPTNAPTYRWQDGSGQPTFQVGQPGEYSLQIRQAGCVAADTIRVNFIKRPQLELGANKELCGAEVYTLRPAVAEGTFAWQDAFPQTERTVSHSGTYRATVRNACATVQDSVAIDYGECGCIVYAPDIFTPNHDGQNDVFQPIACGDIAVQSLSIFNRWGELIFHTETAPFEWNGMCKGAVCQPGVYAWHIDYTLQQREKTSQKQMQGRLVVAY